jgi:hypothetical protein
MRNGVTDRTVVVMIVRESGKERRVRVILSEVFKNNHANGRIGEENDKIITGK